jgi:hypothetical protein
MDGEIVLLLELSVAITPTHRRHFAICVRAAGCIGRYLERVDARGVSESTVVSS